MKKSNKILAFVLALAFVVTTCIPVMAAPEGAKVITGVELREADANYVDSAIYSQYEKVTFSDGSEETINVDEQTFVLVKDGVIVDLADPENWTEDAELYTVNKGKFDEVMMSMNSANWGNFYFTSAVYYEDGKYLEDSSIPAAVQGAEVTDAGVTGGEINIDADYISGIYFYDENGSEYLVKDVLINSAGLGGNDFGTNGAWGATISAAGNANVTIDGVTVRNQGPLNDGIWAGGSSVVDVKNTVVIANENADDFGFEAYSYDKFIIADAELSEEEIAALGISGEFYAEDYESMFGSGTHYYYTNENYTSNFSAPMLQCVPLALGLYGSMRATCCYGQGTLSFYDSLVVSDVWAVLSTDSGSGTLNATDTYGIIGKETDEANADLKVTLNGQDYFIDTFDTTEGCGYVTYCDGFDDNFYGAQFYAPDYLAIITGGTFDFTESETQRGYGKSGRIGFMSHGQAYTANISHSDFDVEDALYAVMSTGATDITLEDITVNYTGSNPWGNVLVQYMDTDDTGTDANDMEMDILDLTYEEYLANEAASEGNDRTLTIKDSVLSGDIYNSLGSSNNAHVSDSYDGTTNYLTSWASAAVNVTLDNATLDGVVSTSYAQHVDEAGEAIEGLFFFNKTGEPMEGDESNTYSYLAARRVKNQVAYNGIGQMNLVLTNGAVWNVTGESILNYLEVGEGCTVNGVVTENEDGTITVTPGEGTVAAGAYGTKAENEAPAAAGSGGGESEGEEAEGESAEEAGEGESAEGESEGEAAEGESAEGESEGGESAEAAGEGEAIGKQQEELEITYNGVTGIALYEDTVDGTSEKRGFQITFDGKVYTGGIDKGVWVADNAEDQELIDIYQAAHESAPGFVGH